MSLLRSFRGAIGFALLTLVVVSCGPSDGGPKNTSNAQTDGPSEAGGCLKTNLEELSLLITIPYDAEDVLDISFCEDKASKRLTAVLRFAEDDTTKLTTDLQKLGAPAEATIETEDWFPDELKGQSELRGETALKGKSYPANPFFLEPYSSGRITRIDGTEFFVLELTAK